MDEQEQPNLFDRFVLLMDQNIRGVQIGVYSVAFVGLAVALRKVRPFSRFTRPSDIPKGFILSRIKLNGTVERVEPNGALLMVQHRPLISIFRSKANSLPVKVSGISVNGHGISWLQSIVSGNKVTFVPVLKDKNYVECEVIMEQKMHDNKLHILNVGPALVAIGFGKIAEIEKHLLKNPEYLAYYRQLKAAELVADRKRLGKWYYVKTTQEVSQKMANFILALFKTMLASKITKKSVKVASA